MTPAQRQYDIDLAASMLRMSAWVLPRSRKIADALKVAAERISALTMQVPIEQPPQNQPASTSDQATDR